MKFKMGDRVQPIVRGYSGERGFVIKYKSIYCVVRMDDDILNITYGPKNSRGLFFLDVELSLINGLQIIKERHNL